MTFDREIPDTAAGTPLDPGRPTCPAVKACGMARPVRFVALLATLASLATPSSPAQQSPSNRMTPRESLGSIKDRLKAEAAQVETAAVSPLFTAIPRLAADPAFRLQDGQVQLCRRLETLARDLVRSRLLRGLDREPPPEAVELEARLSDRGVKLREAIFAHTEEMALQGILSPEQSLRWLTTAGVKPRLSLRGRVKRNVADVSSNQQNVAQLTSELRTLARSFPRSGQVFEVILGQLWIDSEFPDGVHQIDPEVRAKIDAGNLPEVELEPDQRRLAQRLDELTKDIVAAWMVRGLDDKPGPSRPALVERLLRAPVTVDALDAHAEAIALEGILKPDQSGRCLAVLWIRMGVQSLLDPSLSAQLKLTRSQREQIESMIEGKEKLLREIQEATSPLQVARLNDPDLDASLEAFNREVHGQSRVADAAVLEVLTPSQSRRLRQLLAPADPKMTREAKK